MKPNPREPVVLLIRGLPTLLSDVLTKRSQKLSQNRSFHLSCVNGLRTIRQQPCRVDATQGPGLFLHHRQSHRRYRRA
jgi:hypothetical protein